MNISYITVTDKAIKSYINSYKLNYKLYNQLYKLYIQLHKVIQFLPQLNRNQFKNHIHCHLMQFLLFDLFVKYLDVRPKQNSYKLKLSINLNLLVYIFLKYR